MRSVERTRTGRGPRVYLDTSDISYLLLGRNQHDTSWAQKLEKCLELAKQNRAVFFLSYAHLEELYHRPEVHPAALDVLRRTAGVYLIFENAEEIFRRDAQLDSYSITAERLTQELLEKRFGALLDLSSHAAKLFRLVMAARNYEATTANKAFELRGPFNASDQKLIEAMASGDLRPFPEELREQLASVISAVSDIAKSQGIDDLAGLFRAQKHGLGSTWGLVEDEKRLPKREGSRRDPDKVRAMPANTLRADVYWKAESDAGRKRKRSLRLDTEHLAYSLSANLATVDGNVLDDIKNTRPLIENRTRFFPTGHLDPVLQAIEDWEAR